MSTRWTRAFRAASALCLIAGLILVFTFAYGMWQGVRQQQQLNQVWQHQMAPQHQTAPRAVTPKAIDPSLKQPQNGVDFAIRVPKLGYFAAVREGISSGVLYSSPGHYPATPWPGDPGSVGVAAHNVYWINFPNLGKGDEVDLETRYGVYRYRVMDTEIVNPDDRTALIANANGYYLTMTTCWPLWAGAFATKRYIIHASQFSPTPLAPGYT